MQSSLNKITIIGNSQKFIKIIKEAYPNSSINIIPWRKCFTFIQKQTRNSTPDLILVCGYDYESGFYQYEKYKLCNIEYPLQLINFLAGENTKIIYIDTLLSSKKMTFSRYVYAKNCLRNKLICANLNIKTIHFATITDELGKINIYGDNFSKKIFSVLKKMNVVKINTFDSIRKRLIDDIFNPCLPSKEEVITIKPLLLRFKRSLFADRLLRLLYG